MNHIEMEKALIKRYRKRLFVPFVRAINDFQLIEPNDTIAVCMSGGKDSFVLAKLFQELKRHGKIPFEVKFLVMDPGFFQINRDRLEENAKKMGIPIVIKNSNVFEVAEKMGNGQPCYLCARMRRGFLYQFAKEQGCNKIALGHHFDDVIETTLLNIFYAGTYQTMMPKLPATNFPNMELIRPMVYVEEKDIRLYINHCEIQAMNCGCIIACGKVDSKRKEMKDLIKVLKTKHKDVGKNIFQSAVNVNMNCIIGWKKGNKRHTFLENYPNYDEE